MLSYEIIQKKWSRLPECVKREVVEDAVGRAVFRMTGGDLASSSVLYAVVGAAVLNRLETEDVWYRVEGDVPEDSEESSSSGEAEIWIVCEKRTDEPSDLPQVTRRIDLKRCDWNFVGKLGDDREYQSLIEYVPELLEKSFDLDSLLRRAMKLVEHELCQYELPSRQNFAHAEWQDARRACREKWKKLRISKA